MRRDGTMRGYDIKTLWEGKAAAVAAASNFCFIEPTPLEAKIYLKQNGIETRV